jgi:uncharacterized protein YidB (DUF937 family)
MSKSTPSLLALLGLVAVAGYQNRDKISDMLRDARQPQPGGHPGAATSGQPGNGSVSDPGDLFGGLFGAGTASTTLSNGLSDLVDRFRSGGRGAIAESWVSTRPNIPVAASDLTEALGEDTLRDLGRKTGLSRDDLLSRLDRALPEVVDRFTPDGRVPTAAQAQRFD